MLRRIPRLLRRAVILAIVLAVSASVYQSWSAGSPGAGGWTQTQWGPLGPADRDLLVKVRLAGLWEGPTGQQAQQQATSPQVQKVGGDISREHATLDEEVRRVADQLGVPLPSSPNAQQIGWMKDISAQTGSDYDRVFVQKLREAHGNVLPVIAQVRSGTRNELMRQFAVTADGFVARHCQYLESTGLVDYSALPTPPSPGLLAGATGPGDLVVPILVFVAALLAAIGLLAGLRHRSSNRKERVTVPAPQPVAATGPAIAALAIPAPRRSPENRRPEPRDYQLSDSGTYRSVTDSGPNRRVTDTGSYGVPTDTGSHRVGRSGPRHSVRR